jgi:hypothetical protein
VQNVFGLTVFLAIEGLGRKLERGGKQLPLWEMLLLVTPKEQFAFDELRISSGSVLIPRMSLFAGAAHTSVEVP